MEKLKGLFKSFGYAFKGIGVCIRDERNMRIHLTCMVYMYAFLGLTDWFVLSRADWALLFIANAIVVMGELVNTAVESVVNLVTEEKHPLAGRAKDTAAGAVLVGAIFAVATGIAVLWQPEAFRKLFTYFSTHVGMLVLFAVSFAIATVFMLWGFPPYSKKK